MVVWRRFAEENPDLARGVQARFDAYKHKTMATLRKDGSPRISGIEAEFRDGELWLGMMPGSLKARDLQRDPRVALHSGTEDPKEPAEMAGSAFDAKVAGRAIEVPDRQDAGVEETGHSFRIDVEEVVLVGLGDPPDHLVIDSWTVRRGLRRIHRR